MPPSKMQKRKGNCYLCGKHNVPLCSHCNAVHACKLHHLTHYQNEYCFPYTVSRNAIIASRQIQPLELILFERALNFGPKLHETGSQMCAECLRQTSNLQSCSLCGLWVCSDQCQMGHNHYIECQILRNARNMHNLEVKQAAILPIRILASKDLSETSFNKAKLFHQDLQPDKTEQKVVDLIKCLTNAEESEIAWAVSIARQKCVDTFDNRGSAFFPIFSLVEHACFPNAKFWVYQNHCIAMQAQKLIQAGEEIFVSFVPTLEPTWKRRAMLYRNRLKSCYCKRCEDPTEFGSFLSAMACGKCINGLLPINPLDPDSVWTCPVHKKTAICGKLTQQLAIDLQMDLYAGGLTIAITKLEEKIGHLGQFLHPNHGLFMAAQRSLVNCYSQISTQTTSSSRKHQERMKQLCLRQVEIYEKVDSGYADWKGEVFKHLSATLLNLARLDLQEGRVQRPEFLLRVKEAMKLVQEGLRCKSTVKIARSTMTMEEMVDSMSDSESINSNSVSRVNSLLDLSR